MTTIPYISMFFIETHNNRKPGIAPGFSFLVALNLLEELEVCCVDRNTSEVVSCVTQAACRVGKL